MATPDSVVSDFRRADKAASVAHDFIHGLNGITKAQADEAIWTIHEVLRPLASRPPDGASRDARLQSLIAELPHTHGLVNSFDPECSPDKRCLRCELERQADALVAERDRAVEALTYYAEGRIWDNGEIAREGLKT